MTKTVSSGMTSDLQQPATTFTKCWHIIRVDGTHFYFTQFDTNLVIDGQTYLAASGFTPTAISNKSDLSVDNLEVMGLFDDASITLEDVRAGLFDYATVYIFLINWNNVANGPLWLRRGYLGECISSPQGWFQVELRGLVQLLQQTILEEFSPVCRADLGDKRCTKPIDPPLWMASTAYVTLVNQVNTGVWVKAPVNGNSDYSKYGNVIFQCTTAGTTGSTPPTWNTGIGDTTTDGTVVWTTVASWTRDGVVASVDDELDFGVTFTSEDARDVDGWYQYGEIVFDTGLNAGRAMELAAWVKAGGAVTLKLNFGYPVQVGDKFHLSPGCDKTRTTCSAKFANLLNMRAEPDLPLDDYAFYYPNGS